jgi:acyl-coenzyme A thioesterase PaaI-like protein
MTKKAPWTRRLFYRILKFYPPYLGAGIKATFIAPDLSRFDIRMKLRFWNQNAVGTHFGGSLYSMCDPFFMLILIEQLGKDYVVWDKSASIRFLRPGKGPVFASFAISPEEVEAIRLAADREPKVEPTFKVEVKNRQGEVVAVVEKLLYVKRKDARISTPSG